MFEASDLGPGSPCVGSVRSRVNLNQQATRLNSCHVKSFQLSPYSSVVYSTRAACYTLILGLLCKMLSYASSFKRYDVLILFFILILIWQIAHFIPPGSYNLPNFQDIVIHAGHRDPVDLSAGNATLGVCSNDCIRIDQSNTSSSSKLLSQYQPKIVTMHMLGDKKASLKPPIEPGSLFIFPLKEM